MDEGTLPLDFDARGPRLELDPALAHGDVGGPYAANRIVHGENLVALRLLLPELRGRVRCVYIDPPFNTGQDTDHYADGQRSSAWLEMMSERLEVLRETLTEDGSLFVHLDDNELDYLKVRMDELFGRAQMVSRITVAARAPSAFSTVNRGVFKASEYLLWYARDRARFRENPVRVSRPVDRAYRRWVDDPDAPPAEWKVGRVSEAFEARTGTSARVAGPEAVDRFVLEHARHVFRLAAISDTRAGRATVEVKRRSQAERGRVFVVDRGPELPVQLVLDGQQMVFYDRNVELVDGELSATTPLTNVWTDIAWEGIAQEGGVRFKKGKKPERLLRRCLELATDPGDLVLDAFAGSGTTGAVAHKMDRRFVLLEAGEQCLTHVVPRLRRVVAGEDETGVSRLFGSEPRGGFRFLRVTE